MPRELRGRALYAGSPPSIDDLNRLRIAARDLRMSVQSSAQAMEGWRCQEAVGLKKYVAELSDDLLGLMRRSAIAIDLASREGVNADALEKMRGELMMAGARFSNWNEVAARVRPACRASAAPAPPAPAPPPPATTR